MDHFKRIYYIFNFDLKAHIIQLNNPQHDILDMFNI